VSVATKVRPREIIDKDEQDVWLINRAILSDCRRDNQTDQQKQKAM
jgi:hypothetical protein